MMMANMMMATIKYGDGKYDDGNHQLVTETKISNGAESETLRRPAISGTFWNLRQIYFAT